VLTPKQDPKAWMICPKAPTWFIPTTPPNGGRAHAAAAKAGVSIEDEGNILSTPRDIAENPKNIRSANWKLTTLPRVLNQ